MENATSNELAKVLVIEPRRIPYETYLKMDRTTLVRTVGGNLDTYTSGDGSVAWICNSDRETLSLYPNRLILEKDYTVCDIILGTFIIAGMGTDGKYTSLTDEQIEYYTDFYYVPVKLEYYNGRPTLEYDLDVDTPSGTHCCPVFV